MFRVGVTGAAGRVGRVICEAVKSQGDMRLVALVDPLLPVASVREVEPASLDVVVDFTLAGAAKDNMAWCAANGVHAVVGTTGLGDEEIDELRRLFEASTANCVVAPNFAIGAVLMMRFSEIAAQHMDGVEVIELHHDAKIDAPSGTALQTLERIDAARSVSGMRAWPSDPTESTPIAGTRGGVGRGGVHVHSVRLPGLVAHQEVIFGAPGQSLTIRHDTFDRTSFVPGVLLAIRSVAELPGLTTGLETILGI
jgi:4-hydroxy-tetrahydrodipicolinate reductase